MTADFMRTRGELVATLTEWYWSLDVYDPMPDETSANAVRCRDAISEFTRACNWGPYAGNHTVEWCTMFGMFLWHKAAGLDPVWLAHFSQSTYRLWAWATYREFEGHANPAPRGYGRRPSVSNGDDFRVYIDLRDVDDYTTVVQRGDIVIVGDGTPRTGDHGTIAVGVERDAIDTISGNGGGVNSKGKPNNGISRKTYERDVGGYRPMFVVRPAFGDLRAER